MNSYLKVLLKFIFIFILSSLSVAQEIYDVSTLDELRGHKIPKSLLNEISINLVNTPLKLALADISEKGNINISYNHEFIPLEQEVTVQKENVYVVEALLAILEQTSTALSITKNGSILVVPNNKKIQKKGKIYGIVQDIKTGEALPGANVWLEGTTLGSATNINGEYKILNVPPGNYRIRANYIGYEDFVDSINVAPGEKVSKIIKFEYVGAGASDTIVVQAQASGQYHAINQQLSADEIKNVVSSDRLLEVPDANIAESISRLPGISLTRESGEGNAVIIRGLPPKFNKVTVNGVDVGTSEAGDRTSDLSMISSENLAGVEVYKTQLPNMDADAIGGTVNMVLGKAKKDPIYQLRWYGGYNVQEKDYNQYKAFAKVSRRFFNDKLGVQASANIERKNLSRDRLTASFAQSTQLDGRIEYLIKNVSASDRIQIRNRYGISLILDYGNDDNNITLWNFFNRKKDIINNNFHSLSDNAASAIIGANLRELINDVMINSLGGKHTLSNIDIDWKISHTYTKNETPYSYDIKFEEEHSSKPDSRLNPEEFVAALEPDSNALYQGFTNYLGKTSDRRFSSVLNIKIPINISNYLSSFIQIGGKYQYMEKKNTNDYYTLEGIGPRPYQNMDWWFDRKYIPNNFLNGKTNIGITLDPDRLREYYKLVKDYDNYLTSKFYGSNDDYDLIERTSAGYFMANLKYKQFLAFITGVRYENDFNTYGGYYRLHLGGNPLPNGKYEKQTTDVERDYWLPMASLKIKPFDWFDVRMSVTNTLSRPDFYWLSNYDERDVNIGTEIELGVPNLKPAISHNYDIYTSFYDARYGLFTLGMFYKSIYNVSYRIKPYIANEEDAKRWGLKERDGILTERYLNIPVNAPGETIIKGFELDVQANFIFLPGIFQGLIFHGNYSRLFSSSYLPFKKVESYYDPETRRIVTIHEAGFRKGPMPGQARDLVNLTIGYDYKDLSLRTSYFMQGKTLDINGVGQAPAEDRYVNPFSSIDVSAKYRITKNLSMLLNGTNITGTPTSQTQANTSKYRLYENFGAFYYFGIEYHFN